MCNKGTIRVNPNLATATGNSTSTTVNIDHGVYAPLQLTSTSVLLLLVFLVLICFIIYISKHKTNFFHINSQLESVQDWIELEEKKREENKDPQEIQ